jgi:hypothetical protein
MMSVGKGGKRRDKEKRRREEEIEEMEKTEAPICTHGIG